MREIVQEIKKEFQETIDKKKQSRKKMIKETQHRGNAMPKHRISFKDGTTVDVIFKDKRLGKKIGNYIRELGKDPDNPDEKLWFYNKIKETIDSPNRRIRKGQYHTEGECFLIYTEHYATIIKTDGEFVTFYSLKSKPLNPKRQAKAAIPLNEREWFKAMKKIE